MVRSFGWWAGLFGAWCGLAAFVACSSSGADGGSGPADAAGDAGPIASDAGADTADGSGGEAAADAEAGDDLGPMAAYCVQLAAATCDRRAYCAGRPDPSCQATTAAQCRTYARAQIVEALDAGVIGFDPVRAAACFASPFDDYCQPQDFSRLETCRGVFRGTVPLGAPCFRVYMFGEIDECATGRCSAGEVSGTCAPGACQPFLDAGAACLDDAGSAIAPGCAAGFSCSQGVCAADRPLGAPCAHPGELCRPTWPQIECAPASDGGLACDFGRSTGGLCAYQEAGVDEVCRSQSCGANGTCDGTTADGGILCATTSGPCPTGTACQSNGKDPSSCQPPRAAGAGCAPGDVCVDGFACAPSSDGGASTCVALPAPGQPCDGACTPGATCSHLADAGVCAAVVGGGGACRGAGDDTCAPGLVCNASSKSCVPFAAPGAACAVDGDCDVGLYCDAAARVCRTWKRHGDPCARDAECVSAIGCLAGRCVSACTVP